MGSPGQTGAWGSPTPTGPITGDPTAGFQYNPNTYQWEPAPGTQMAPPPAPAPAAPQGPPGPALVNGTPIQGEGLSLTDRGEGEKFWKDTSGFYTQPTKSDDFFTAMNTKFNNGTLAPPTSNDAEAAYQAFLHGPTSAGLDPYYANAKRIAGNDINNSLSSRGLYGSSAADNSISTAMTNLSADEANRNAAFDMNRAALLGTLGSAADTSSVAGSTNTRNWDEAMGKLATGTDATDLNRITAGQAGGNNVETEHLNRLGDIFNDQFKTDTFNANAMNDWYTKMLGGDQTNFENGQTAATGAATNHLNDTTNNATQSSGSWKDAATAAVGAVKPTISIYDQLNKPVAPATPDQISPHPATTAVYQYPGTASDPSLHPQY